MFFGVGNFDGLLPLVPLALLLAQRVYVFLMAKAMGKNVAVSIYGKAKDAIYNAAQMAYDILALERIDWTPPGAAGIPNDGTLILTSEIRIGGVAKTFTLA